MENASRPASARHLSSDAEFAEDLAIRYADTHHGLRTPHYVSGAAYAAARDRCMNSLFEQIATAHGVPAKEVSSAVGQNRAHIDLAVNLPFILLYCIVVGSSGSENLATVPTNGVWLVCHIGHGTVRFACSVGSKHNVGRAVVLAGREHSN